MKQTDINICVNISHCWHITLPCCKRVNSLTNVRDLHRLPQHTWQETEASLSLLAMSIHVGGGIYIYNRKNNYKKVYSWT